MRFLFRLFLLLVIGIVLLWVFRAPVLDRLGLAASRSARQIGSEVREAFPTAEPSAHRQLPDLDLSVEKIAQELKATGRVVRRKAVEAGRQFEESTRDGRTTARLKARFALDPELKAHEIEVHTDDGRVSLTGRVDSPEQVARAVRMAVEEDDVLEVTSTLQVNDRTRRARPTPTPLP
jgi:Flp pilus assembly secretin CpaC